MSRKEQIIIVVVLGFLLTAWLIGATQVVPPLISAAFRGESHPVFNQVFRARKTYTLDEYLQRWNHVTAIVALGIVCAGLLLTSAPDALTAALGVTTLIVVGYVLVLFSARARIVFPLLAVAMHLGIFAMQNILFFDLLLIQLVFVDFDKLWSAASSRLLRLPTTAIDPVAANQTSRDNRSSRPSIAVSLVCLAFLGLIITAGLFKLNYYPITGWEMYSGVSSEPAAEYCYVH